MIFQHEINAECRILIFLVYQAIWLSSESDTILRRVRLGNHEKGLGVRISDY